ncbi:hypothetical protein JCM1840_004379 [Sporobolomyces johnsonii]
MAVPAHDPFSSLYTPFYCEENVYLLLQSLHSSPSRFSRCYAAFISNPIRHCLLFKQKASRRTEMEGSYVIWDYHVVAVVVEREEDGEEVKERVRVLDRDSRLGMSVDLADYVQETFQPDLYEQTNVDVALRSRIRVVPAQDFLANFASDRSHMLLPTATANLSSSDASDLSSSPLASLPARYIQPAPPYPAICGSSALARGQTHNLWTKFLDMRLDQEREEKDDEAGFGVVLERPEELLGFPW